MRDSIYGFTRAEWDAMSPDERMVASGRMAPVGECGYCDRARASNDKAMPSHKASDRCRSNKYPHCTCDTCY